MKKEGRDGESLRFDIVGSRLFLISWGVRARTGRARAGGGAGAGSPFNLLPRLTRIRRCVPAKLKDLLRVPPLLNVLHTRPGSVCVLSLHTVCRNYISHES